MALLEKLRLAFTSWKILHKHKWFGFNFFCELSVMHMILMEAW